MEAWCQAIHGLRPNQSPMHPPSAAAKGCRSPLPEWQSLVQRLNYQVKRDEKLRDLGSVLAAMVQQVGKAQDEDEGKARYRRLTDFFEAVVAYLPEK